MVGMDQQLIAGGFIVKGDCDRGSRMLVDERFMDWSMRVNPCWK